MSKFNKVLHCNNKIIPSSLFSEAIKTLEFGKSAGPDAGAYAGFLRGGGQFNFFWDFGYTCREAACREQRSCEPLLGGFGPGPTVTLGVCSPKKICESGAISCVLRAIFNHFHDIKSSQIIRNKQEFFH